MAELVDTGATSNASSAIASLASGHGAVGESPHREALGRQTESPAYRR